MSDDPEHETSAPRASVPSGHDGRDRSVLQFLEERTGEAHRVSLREEDSAAVSAPLIDPSSTEKTAVPQGRGSYQLLGEIARGGMGVILKGHDTDLGRDVAVKVLDKRLAERPEVVQRFVEEAQIGGQLQHPGIVPVYELGLMADERPYFTMKLVKGRTLATLLTERESPNADRRKLLDVFESVCQTVAYAHSRGVIHRDLKPANIMVGAFGEVQVVDWGLAKVLARGGKADEKRAREMQSHLTILETVRSDGSGSGSESMVGSILGTPAYMPPEQASGLVDRLDERADVFALGAILCEILTGLPPYVGAREEVIAAAAQAEYEDALQRLDASGADEDLVKLTRQCLLAAPAARPANAGVVAERVHDNAVSVEERAHAAHVEAAAARVRVVEERKKRRLSLALGLSVAATLLVGGGGWSYLENERAAQAEADARREATLAREEAARQAAESERAAALSSEVLAAISEASRLEGGGDFDGAIRRVEQARAKAEGGGAEPGLLARVDEVQAELERGRDEQLARLARERDTQELLAELLELRGPDWETLDSNNFQSAQREAGQIEATFLAHGIDLSLGDEDEAARLLTERGLGAEIALVLDGWAGHLRVMSDDAGAARLLRIGSAVDPDPLRADLRAAFERQERDVLLWIADNGLELQPPGTYELLGVALHRLGEKEASRSVYRAGIRAHPDDFGLALRLGRGLIPGLISTSPPEDLHEGVACMHAALALRPESDLARFYLGRFYSELGRPEEALEQFEILAARDPLPAVRLFLGLALVDAGRGERAVPILEELVEGPGLWWAKRSLTANLGLAHWQSGNLEAAARHLAGAVEAMHTRGDVVPDLTVALFDIYEELHGDARAAFRHMRERFPTDSTLRNNVAWHLLMDDPRFHLLDELVGLAEEAVALEPRGTYWNTLSVAYYFAGDYGPAIDAAHESLRSEDGTTLDVLLLALSHHRLGDRDEALAWFERAQRELEVTPEIDGETLRFLHEARIELR